MTQIAISSHVTTILLTHGKVTMMHVVVGIVVVGIVIVVMIIVVITAVVVIVIVTPIFLPFHTLQSLSLSLERAKGLRNSF